jgi:hypothetical protein
MQEALEVFGGPVTPSLGTEDTRRLHSCMHCNILRASPKRWLIASHWSQDEIKIASLHGVPGNKALSASQAQGNISAAVSHRPSATGFVRVRNEASEDGLHWL